MSVANILGSNGIIKAQYLSEDHQDILVKGTVALDGTGEVVVGSLGNALKPTDVIIVSLYNGSGVTEFLCAEYLTNNQFAIYSSNNTSSKTVSYTVYRS
jgi:hypothetical protein